MSSGLATRVEHGLSARGVVRVGRGRWTATLPAALPLGLLIPLGASDGGYFPTAWGWSALALAWVAALLLILRGEIRLGGLDLLFLGGLAGHAGWAFLSALWAHSATQPVLEGERALVYVSGALALLLLARSASILALLAGAWGAIALVSGYALLTRLLPERLGVVDPIAGYRLSEPIGYWNGLGALAAVGALLALGLAARARGLALRAAAAASLPMFILALYFTFSRGAWIGLAAGALAAVAFDCRRLQLLCPVVALGAPAAVAVWLASRSDALTRQSAAIADAARDGHRVLLAAIGLAAASAALAVVLALAERRVAVGRRARAAAGLSLALLAALALALVFARYDSPVLLAGRGWDAFRGPAAEIDGDLNRRLFNLSGSGRVTQWEVAWKGFESSPVLGLGAGGYERYWLEHRPVAGSIRDAHSLYLEQLAELGPVGAGFIAVALAIPLVAGVKARRHPLAAGALAAYVAYLVHAGGDWDWEMPALTLSALLCGAALLGAARDEGARRWSRQARQAAVVGALALAAFSFVGLLGNEALSSSAEAAAAGDWREAKADARRAIRFAPWSSQPWRRLGEAQLGQGDVAAARASFRQAIAKDGRDWALWLDLARASEGEERRKALARAAELNPLSPEVALFRAELEYEAPIDVAVPEGGG